MAKNKTTETQNSVTDFLATLTDEKKRKDSTKIIELIAAQTNLEPKMWGSSIIGFGSYHYKYESGREDDAPLVSISPRVNAISLYLGTDFEQRSELLSKFGKHKTGKSCIYIQKIEDIDTSILAQMVQNSIDFTRNKYPIDAK